MKSALFSAALCGFALLSTPASAEDDIAALKAEAGAVIQSFSGALLAELKAAIQAGGPSNGIAVCNEKAPGIAAAAGEASGWSVARSSHKLRNPENAPDAFTEAAIADFVAREAAGEALDGLVAAEITEGEDGRVFRFVKAIPTGEPCTACHGGDNVSADVVAKLAELYPEDQARGFAPGQMRGVFTLAKALD